MPSFADYLHQPVGPDMVGVAPAPMEFLPPPPQRQQGGGNDSALKNFGTAMGGWLDRRADHNAAANTYDAPPLRRKPEFGAIMDNAMQAA